MALPTVEFVVAPATDAFRANPSDLALVKPTVEIMKSVDGMIKVYYGLQKEDQASALVVVAWRTLADHDNLRKDTKTYSKLTKANQSIFDVSKSTIFHAMFAFSGEPYPAFEAPVTEVAISTLKEGQSKETLAKLVDTMVRAFNAAGKASGVVHATWGPMQENENAIVVVIGWASMDAHPALVKSDLAITSLINQIGAIATVEMKHVSLAHS